MTKDERRDFRSFLQGFFLGCPFTYALTRDDSRNQLAYAVDWIITECDEEHQNLNWQTLDASDIRELAGEACDAWNGGAR